MCGIVGFVSQGNTVEKALYAGLKAVEYRGYDSCGVCLITENECVVGKSMLDIEDLEKKMGGMTAHVGIGHTRWATHGIPSLENAHPHESDNIVLIHNGIIDNFADFIPVITEAGYVLKGKTDSEVLAHMIDYWWKEYGCFHRLLSTMFQRIQGQFSCVFLVKNQPDTLIAVRSGAPALILGKSTEGYAVASDVMGHAGWASAVSYMESDTYALIRAHDIAVYDHNGTAHDPVWVSHPVTQVCSVGEEHYAHHMLQEIHAQKEVLTHLSQQHIVPIKTLLQEWGYDPAYTMVSFVGCGTSFYAAALAQHFWEKEYFTSVHMASEFYAREPRMLPGITVGLSQSGETVDTVKSLLHARTSGQKLIGVVNVLHSVIGRMCDHVIHTEAGPEIGVASTKSFTAQVYVLLAMLGHMQFSPATLDACTMLTPIIRIWADALCSYDHILYVGRGPATILAQEAALKTKELAYIHAEGLSAGEFKHGPIALIDDRIPIVVFLPSDEFFQKTLSNIHEMLARKARIYIITDQKGASFCGVFAVEKIMVIPHGLYNTDIYFSMAMMMQLLAYYMAYNKGNNIDKPRHLAKSVTVE